ncbi:MAG: AMP-dependent synthetase and ligase [Gammaproteobacteria bacterium]|nr:AMP-dependent synthetase and ligase [Gammaproteobacteria bacterium]
MAIRYLEKSPEAYTYPLLIKHLLHAPLAAAPHQEIVYRDRTRLSYAEFGKRLCHLANALTKLGVRSGSTVAVMDWDSHRYLECYFAIPMLGAVLQTVNVRLSPQEILFTLQSTQAEVALVNRDFLPLLTQMRSQLPQLEAVVLLDDDGDTSDRPRWVVAEYESLLAGADSHYEFEDFDEHVVATVFHTTGTTGLPKGVCFSHRQIVLLALTGGVALASPAHGQSMRHGDVYMPLTPMFHVHAWGAPYVATMLGLKQVYPGRYVPTELIALKNRERVTFSHCVPTILQMLLQGDSGGEQLRGWKMVIGGAALGTGLAEAALRAGIDVFAGYGMSETGPTLTVARLRDSPSRLTREAELQDRCCAGLPLPLVDLRLRGGTESHSGDGPPSGEIVVRAPWATWGYLGDPKASTALWEGGYLHTQDVGTIDATGQLHVTDRIKDVIKSGGEWISSLQLEELLGKHPGVAEVAVVGVPDARWGERPLAIVVPQAAGSDTLETELLQLVQEQVEATILSRFAIPDRFVIVPSIEKTSVGKINKRLLRERYASAPV